MKLFSFVTISPATQHSQLVYWLDGAMKEEETAPAGVFDMRMYPGGQFIFMGLSNGDVVVQKNTTGKAKVIISLPGLSTIALSKDGRYIATGCMRGFVEVWRLPESPKQKREKVTVFRNHTGPITVLAFHDNATVLSGGTDQLLYWWEAATGRVLQCCEGHDSEISALTTTNGPSCITGGGVRDGTIKIWNLEYGAEILSSSKVEGGIYSLAVACESGDVFVGTQDGRLKCWNLEAKALTADIQLANRPVNSLIYVEKDKTVLAGCQDGSIHFRSLASLAQIRLPVRAPGAVLGMAVFNA